VSFQEKRSYVGLITTVIVSVAYIALLLQRLEGAALAGQELSFWGGAILLFIPVSVAAQVAVHIVFVIINTVTGGEREPRFSDELDHLVSLKATRNFYHTFMAGFVLAMGAVALSQAPFFMFLILFLGMVIASMVLEFSQLYYYRRGV
jgi:hypothetical protein